MHAVMLAMGLPAGIVSSLSGLRVDISSILLVAIHGNLLYQAACGFIKEAPVHYHCVDLKHVVHKDKPLKKPVLSSWLVLGATPWLVDLLWYVHCPLQVHIIRTPLPL